MSDIKKKQKLLSMEEDNLAHNITIAKMLFVAVIEKEVAV